MDPRSRRRRPPPEQGGGGKERGQYLGEEPGDPGPSVTGGAQGPSLMETARYGRPQGSWLRVATNSSAERALARAISLRSSLRARSVTRRAAPGVAPPAPVADLCDGL